MRHISHAVCGLVLASASPVGAQPNQWVVRSSGISSGDTIRDVAFGPYAGTNGLFIGVAFDSWITVSDDGTTWFPQALRNPGIVDYSCIASNGSGAFYIGGDQGAIDVVGPGGGGVFVGSGHVWAGIAFGNGIISAVGGKFTVQNGWKDIFISRPVNSNQWSYFETTSSCQQLCAPYCVQFGGGQFLAGLGDGRVLTSTNGVNYSSHSILPSTVDALTYNSGTWFAASGGQIYRSTNGGFSWSSVASGLPRITCLGFGGGYYVAGALNGRIYISSNGTSWSNVPSPVTTELSGVSYGRGTWVLVGSNAVVLQSSINPDFTPQQPSGWPSALVLSSEPGTQIEDQLREGDSIYLDCAVLNQGRSAGSTIVEVLLDGSPVGRFNANAILPGATRELLDISLGTLSAGPHTVALRIDPDNLAQEVDDRNNFRSRDLVVAPSCPADFNGDGFVDFFDYDDFVQCFEIGACPPGETSDFNEDGFVDFFDYDAFVISFESPC